MIGSQLLGAIGSAHRVYQDDIHSDHRWNYSTIRFEDDEGWWAVPWRSHRSGDGRELGLMFEVVPLVRRVQIVEHVTWERDRS
jgi:hypothetical protein